MNPDDTQAWLNLLVRDRPAFNRAAAALSPGEHINLRGVSLAGVSLVDARLARADLSGADLSDCHILVETIASARIEGTVLDGVVAEESLEQLRQIKLLWKSAAMWNLYRESLAPEPFIGVDFSGAQLGAANLSGLTLNQSRFDRANFSACRLDGAYFIQCSLVGADFRGATLDGISFDGANATGARFDGARLSRCRMSGTRVAGASFVGATGHELSGAVGAESAIF